MANGKRLDAFDTGGRPGLPYHLAAIADGKRVVCCPGKGAIVWDLQAKTRKILPLVDYVPLTDTAVAPASWIDCKSVASTADGKCFATTACEQGYGETFVVLWDAESCRATKVISLGARGNGCMALAPDGSAVAADYYDSSLDPDIFRHYAVGIWDATSGECLLRGARRSTDPRTA